MAGKNLPYKTALEHLEKAEAILGHTFSSPPTEQEIIYFTAYLAQREVAKSTIQSYLSAVRYISLSRGASHHTKIPELSTQILAGAANIKKDARIEAEKPKEETYNPQHVDPPQACYCYS